MGTQSRTKTRESEDDSGREQSWCKVMAVSASVSERGNLEEEQVKGMRNFQGFTIMVWSVVS